MAVSRPYFMCEICEEIHPRTSNVQKYCAGCRKLAASRKVAQYYLKHRKKILSARAHYRQENRQTLNEKARLYYFETK